MDTDTENALKVARAAIQGLGLAYLNMNSPDGKPPAARSPVDEALASMTLEEDGIATFSVNNSFDELSKDPKVLAEVERKKAADKEAGKEDTADGEEKEKDGEAEKEDIPDGEETADGEEKDKDGEAPKEKDKDGEEEKKAADAKAGKEDIADGKGKEDIADGEEKEKNDKADTADGEAPKEKAAVEDKNQSKKQPEPTPEEQKAVSKKARDEFVLQWVKKNKRYALNRKTPTKKEQDKMIWEQRKDTVLAYAEKKLIIGDKSSLTKLEHLVINTLDKTWIPTDQEKDVIRKLLRDVYHRGRKTGVSMKRDRKQDTGGEEPEPKRRPRGKDMEKPRRNARRGQGQGEGKSG